MFIHGKILNTKTIFCCYSHNLLHKRYLYRSLLWQSLMLFRMHYRLKIPSRLSLFRVIIKGGDYGKTLTEHRDNESPPPSLA